jgi:putative Mg2+ transporter-C (MgtC) family protein
MYLEHIPILSTLNIFSITIRILLALVLGGLLGIDRQQKQRPAGFRTYVIVCLGATLASITNIYMCDNLGSSDPARIPAQVISGIGFLGAGTILVTRNQHIKGLTTAAGLWCVATIGIAVGSGFYSGAIICTVVIVFSLRILTFVDTRVSRHNKYIRIYAEYDNSIFIRKLIQYCALNNCELHELEISPANNNSFSYATYSVKVSVPEARQPVLTDMKTLDGVILLEELSS